MSQIWVVDQPAQPARIIGGMGFPITIPAVPEIGHWETVADPTTTTTNSSTTTTSTSTSTTTSTVAPKPNLPVFKPITNVSTNFKVAPSDIIQFDDSSVEIALIQDLLFEDIGAVELANISRSDLIDGQDTIYSPIKNLSVIRRQFNPNNIISIPFGQDFFAKFGIDISGRGIYTPYFDTNGDLVIEIETVLDGEEIQVEVLSDGIINIVSDI